MHLGHKQSAAKCSRLLQEGGFDSVRYVTKVLLGLDQFANTIIGGAPDETISARAGRLRSRQGWKQLAWALDHLQPNHVEEAIKHELDGSQQDPYYKGKP